MSFATRGVLALVIVAGTAVGVWALARDEAAEAGPAGAAGPRFDSAAQCRDCHREVWDEWHGSHHQIAYLNPEVRALSDDFRNKECQACHLPRPVAVTGYGSRVLPRQTHPEEGVSCLTCHLGADGTVLGRSARSDAPCRPAASAELVSVELCASCHNQHGTTDQWRESPQAAAGQDCNSCHMPPAARGEGGSGRSHRYPGAHDAAMLRAAVRLEVEVVDGELRATVVNHGAGHNAPTEERHRAIDVELQVRDRDGVDSPWQRLWRFRQPYRDEPGDNTQLPAGESKIVTATLPEGATRATVRLWYRLTPFVGDDDPKSTLLFEREVALP